jgi:hypothetical protein
MNIQPQSTSSSGPSNAPRTPVPDTATIISQTSMEHTELHEDFDGNLHHVTRPRLPSRPPRYTESPNS